MKALALLLVAFPAVACDRVEYAEAKTWSAAKLQAAYCETTREQFERLRADLEHKMGWSRADARVCEDQLALYKRLLAGKGKAEPKSCK